MMVFATSKGKTADQNWITSECKTVNDFMKHIKQFFFFQMICKVFRIHTATPPRPPVTIPIPMSTKLLRSDKVGFNFKCM